MRTGGRRRPAAALAAALALAWGTGHADAPVRDSVHAAHPYATLAFSAAMQGRKAETLVAVQRVGETLPLETVLASGGSGWALSQQYAALVRFGLWDEAIALSAPDPRAPGLTAAWLYGRGVALAARGRLEEAQAALGALGALAGSAPPGAVAGTNPLRGVLAVAAPVVAARIAATQHRDAEAIARLEQAVVAEDRLARDEPEDWFFPARHLLGAQLLIARRPRDAERVYREDLRRHPHNGWALYGLAAALSAQHRRAAAAKVRRQFSAAWQGADVRLVSSAFWFAGPDTTSCECERSGLPAAASRR